MIRTHFGQVRQQRRADVSTIQHRIGTQMDRTSTPRPASSRITGGVMSDGTPFDLNVDQMQRDAKRLASYITAVYSNTIHLRSLGRVAIIPISNRARQTIRRVAKLHKKHHVKTRDGSLMGDMHQCQCVVPWDTWHTMHAVARGFQIECERESHIPFMDESAAAVPVQVEGFFGSVIHGPAESSESNTPAAEVPISYAERRCQSICRRLRRLQKELRLATDLVRLVRLASQACSREGCPTSGIHCLSHQLNEMSASLEWTLHNAQAVTFTTLICQ